MVDETVHIRLTVHQHRDSPIWKFQLRMRATLWQIHCIVLVSCLPELLVTICLWFKSTRVDIGAMCYLHVFHVLIDIKFRVWLASCVCYFLATSTKVLMGAYVLN